MTLSFSGSLYLNLVVFVDQSATGNQKYAWDITHCGLDFSTDVPAAYSSIHTTNTQITGPEQALYSNLNSTVDKNVYILVYSADGAWQLDLHNYM